MTSSLHERVAAAVELASRATQGHFDYVIRRNRSGFVSASVRAYYTKVDDNGAESQITAFPADLESPTEDNSANARLFSYAHTHVDLIRDLYAALLSSEEARAKYDQLIMAVSMKLPGETRHETALRYIRRAENQCNSPSRGAAMKVTP